MTIYPNFWHSGMPETPCGKGAKISETVTIRRELPKLVDSYNIRSIADVGCGDQNWMKEIKWQTPVAVEGFDAAPINGLITTFDCTKEVLPPAFDMIQCCYVLNHLYYDGAVGRALANFERSGVPWLLVTYAEFNGLTGLSELGDPVKKIYHKTKINGGVAYNWFYGLFRLG